MPGYEDELLALVERYGAVKRQEGELLAQLSHVARMLTVATQATEPAAPALETEPPRRSPEPLHVVEPPRTMPPYRPQKARYASRDAKQAQERVRAAGQVMVTSLIHEAITKAGLTVASAGKADVIDAVRAIYPDIPDRSVSHALQYVKARERAKAREREAAASPHPALAVPGGSV